MDFINRCIGYKPKQTPVLKLVEDVKDLDYKAAGCLFTDGRYVLAGVQRKKRVLSGLGGSRMAGETYIQTALRELVEELFEIHDLCSTAYDELALVVATKTQFDGGYINVVYNFKDLEQFLRILSKYESCRKTALYVSFPLTINELVFGRNLIDSSEITHLMLLPIIDYDKKIGYIDPVFLNDIACVVNPPTCL